MVRDQTTASRLAFVVIATLTLVRLGVAGQVGLGDAEAYYWSWSRALAPGYLDHGPAVAWLIRLGTEVAGNQGPFAVRWPFVLASALTLALVAGIARRRASSQPGSAALFGVLLLSAMPMFIVAGAAANPDVPFILLVVLFIAALLRTVDEGERPRAGRWLLLAGLFGGLSCCAKLFGAALLVPLVLAAWRRPGRAINLAGGLATFAAGASPWLLWNATHGWASFRYHLVDRHSKPAGLGLDNLGKLVGGQLGYVSPIVLVAMIAALVWLWRRRDRPDARLLLATALPLLAGGYGLIALVPGAEPHWPAAGYVPLAIAAAGALPDWWRLRRTRALGWIALAFSAVVAVAFHLHLLTDVGVRLMPEQSYQARFDLANELIGWPEVADQVKAAIRRAPRSSRTVAAGCHYTSCAQLEHAAGGRFEVLCPSPRRSQFDLRPGGDGQDRRGIDIVYVRDERFPFDAAELYRCARTTDVGRVRIRRGGRLVRRFVLQRCDGFAGLRITRWPPR